MLSCKEEGKRRIMFQRIAAVYSFSKNSSYEGGREDQVYPRKSSHIQPVNPLYEEEGRKIILRPATVVHSFS
jgi:hypothetical protein